jgi:glycosyltransferase involved in cell wall biosynthesis
MLGWEFPPHISGGLGTACEGLAKALTRQGVRLCFVLPRVYGDETPGAVRLLSPFEGETGGVTRGPGGVTGLPTGWARPAAAGPPPPGEATGEASEAAATFLWTLDSPLSPYLTPAAYLSVLGPAGAGAETGPRGEAPTGVAAPSEPAATSEADAVPEAARPPQGEHYGRDLYGEVARYARQVGDLARRLSFDLIHAHDWMTWPAALYAREVSGRPVVLHVHSLEFDRSGVHVNRGIDAIEREGLRAADHIVTVSHYTKGVVMREHGIPERKITVVHNGVTRAEGLRRYHLGEVPEGEPKVVLFLGRVTFQKGPDYFVEAAAKVLPLYPNVRFVVAGSGDLLEAIKARVRKRRLDPWFEFTGFLVGEEVERMFTRASLYVMPSVSEPFGISPLEAMVYDTPVIISKQSGVAEVLRHALKVDFWDTDQMADLILGVLSHKALSEDMLRMGRQEILGLHWTAAARKARALYQTLVYGKG